MTVPSDPISFIEIKVASLINARVKQRLDFRFLSPFVLKTQCKIHHQKWVRTTFRMALLSIITACTSMQTMTLQFYFRARIKVGTFV